MPFTVSHTAAVLPLKILQPRWFSLTGLMAGAMSPDLIYFLMLQTNQRGVSHSWLGLFLFCLPAGIAFSFAFHWLFKQPAVEHLPWPLDRHWSGLADQSFRVPNARAWLVLVASVLIGTLSHFAWDSFTHGAGEIARMFPVLNKEFTLLGVTRSLCRFLQHLSTIVGAVVVMLFAFKSRLLPPPTISRPRCSPGRKFGFWVLGGVVSTLFAVQVVTLFERIYGFDASADYTQYPVVSSFGLAGWAGFFYYCCTVRLFALMRRRRRRSAR
jgi:hypothetical protein